MSQGARNWPFLTLIARAGPGGGDQQVGLAAQKSWDLQHVDGFGDRRALRRHRARRSRPASRSVSRISAKIGSAASNPMPRAPFSAGAVRLVERCLENEPMPSRPAISFSAARSRAHAPAFQCAGPGEDRKRRIIGDGNRSDPDNAIGRGRCALVLHLNCPVSRLLCTRRF